MKTYIKKILGVLLCFCFLIGSNLCTFAVGDDDASIWVGDVRLYDGDSTTAFGGTASYAGGILTLNGVTVPKTKFHNDAAIYTEYDLTIKLMGTNTVTGPDVDAGSYGIHAYGVNLTFTGNGSLASHGGITSVVSLMYSCGISTRGSDKAANISIYDSVSILSTGDEGYYSNGVYCGELSIFSIAKLTAIGAADGALCAKSCGVQASLLIINGGELLARGNVACKLYGLVPEAFPYIFGSTDINAAIDTLAEAAYSETDQSIRINYAAAKTVLIRDMYTVTFNPNGATGVMNPMDCAKYDSFYMPECGFDTPAGCYFKYWTINSPDGKTINAHESLLLNGDITLYPFWASLEAPQITSSEYYDYPKNTESSIPLSASGTAPIVWSLASGSSLPTGLSLNPATGQIYGTTTAAEGYYDFTVTATNSKGSDSKAVTLCIVDDYSVSIGNKILKSGNSTTAFGGTASFNNGVLTLNNVTVTAENTNDDAQIYSLFPLTINLIGNNKMTGRNYGGDLGIHVCGDLTFKGNGSLEITSCNYISRSLNKGIYVEGNLLLTEQAAVISNSGAVGNANYNSYGADVKGNITLSDSSSLTVKSARSNYAYGLYCRENLTIKDNAVLNSSAQGFSDNASYGASILGNVTISGGRLTSIGLTKGIDTRVNSSVILSERLIVMGKTSAVENEGQLTRAFFAACNLQDETVYTQGTYDNPSGKALTVKIFEPEELTVSDDEFSIPDSVVNNPINEIDIASYVSGGILPYHFELSVAPEWLSISENGILSGTPTQVADLATAKVIITDSAATAANVTVTVTIGDIVSEPTFSDGYYLIHNAAHLYWFAAKVNAGNTGYNARLMKDIELNPGYTFAFDPDTGLVEMKKDGVAAGYFGTDKAGDENGNTIFDTTASGIGAFYPSKDSANAGTLTESPLTWMPIENYTGTFDGNGKTVSGLYFNDNNKSNVGLFGYIGFVGEVKNVTVANSYINGLKYIGGVCGYNYGEIKNCHSTGTVSGNTHVGGVCGYNGGDITSCSNTETVSGSGTDDNGYTYVGGVCGYNDGDITSCSNTGNVSGSGDFVGGICGMSEGTITSCYNTGTVSGDGDFVGGVCGNNHSEDNGNYTGIITNCHNTGAVSGSGDPVGGVCGYNNGGITNCYNIGDVSSDDNNVGGVCGYNNGGITNCYNIGTVSSDDDMDPYVGGVCGYNCTGNSIANCYNIGEVSGVNNRNVGGVCGYNDNNSLITNCYYFDAHYNETDSIDGTSAKDERDFQSKDGVTEFLNNNDSINPLVWYQGSEYPRLIPYRASESDPYEIYTADDLIWFAAEVNGGNTGYNARLMKDIELNPGYTFAFDPDTGLVEMKKDGVAAGYFGTDKAGDENGNTIFDTTASGIGAFYPSKDSSNAGTLTESLREWTPIGNYDRQYTGTFDGNGKTVSGIYFNDPDKHYIGLFGYSKGNGKSIKNLTVADSCIIAADNVGSVCGYKEGTGTITSCTNTGVVIGSDRVSGICGYFISGTIHDCSNTGTVIGTGQNIGGVCGYASGNATIQYCYNTGAVIGDLNTGGVCGYASGNATIQYCYNTGMVIGDSNTGGVCGYSDNSEIQYCYNTGAVSGDLNIGGVCGSDGGTIQYCFYLDSLETDFFEGTFYATAEDFADGKVTYLLNDSRSEGTKEDPLVWYQNIDNGETPDTSPKFTGGTVYYVPELSKYSNYPDETPTEIISVTITWGAMEFTYIDASEGTWNPDTLSYENPTPAVWTCDADANKITVTSESNVELTALFIYEQAEGVTVNGSFTDGTNPITDALPLAKGNETPQTVVAYLKLDGKPSRDIDAKLGTATITINEISKKAAG